MPDHLHLLIFVSDYLDRAIGTYLAILKANIRKEWANGAVFTKDFHDRIIQPWHSLQDVYDYIRTNPRRLAIRLERPEFFQRVTNLYINGEYWQAYGNLQLLRNPFKSPVIIHRSDSPALLTSKRNMWIHLATNGGVLVSPFISKAEKEIRQQLETASAKQIRITNEPFPAKFKPAAHDFQLCEKGLLLLLAPMHKMDFSRECCLKMNGVAKTLAHSSAQSFFTESYS